MKRLLCIATIATLAGGVLQAAESPVKNWKDTAQFSFLDANGNTESTTLGASNLFTWTRNKWTLLLPAGALNTKSNGVRTAEQYYAGEKVEYKLDDRNYLFERYQWERNVFAGFAHRHDLCGKHVNASLGHIQAASENRRLFEYKDQYVFIRSPGTINHGHGVLNLRLCGEDAGDDQQD